MRSFAGYLKERGLRSPPAGTIWLFRQIARGGHVIDRCIARKIGWNTASISSLLEFKGQSLLFQWGKSELKKRYQGPLDVVFRSGGQEGSLPTG